MRGKVCAARFSKKGLDSFLKGIWYTMDDRKGGTSMGMIPVDYNEAFRLAQRIYQVLEEAEAQLQSAKRWGVFDLFMGGTISSLVKRRKMENAESAIQRANVLLKQLQLIIEDIHVEMDSEVVQSQRGVFFDLFFDNIFSDVVTQNRITEALETVAQYKTSMNGVLYQIEKQLA